MYITTYIKKEKDINKHPQSKFSWKWGRSKPLLFLRTSTNILTSSLRSRY